MRTLLEIIEAAKDGNRPSPDECYFAMLALDALSTFTTRDLRNLGLQTREAKLLGGRMLAEEDHRRWKRALNTPPDEWLGPHNTPGNPTQQATREVAKKVLAKVERDIEAKKASGAPQCCGQPMKPMIDPNTFASQHFRCEVCQGTVEPSGSGSR